MHSIISRERSTNDKMIQVVVEKCTFLRKKILINYSYFCNQQNFDFYEVAYQYTYRPNFQLSCTSRPPIYATEHNNFPSFFLRNISHPISSNLHTNVGLNSHNPYSLCYVFFFKVTFTPPPTPLSRIHTYSHFSRFTYHPPSTGVACVILPILPINPTEYMVVTNSNPPIAAMMFIINFMYTFL